MGELDNTLILYVVGDNGASAEGQMNGMFNEMSFFNGVPETVQEMLKHYDEWGSESTYRMGRCFELTLSVDETMKS